MNKLTKILSLVLALMILTLSLAACGGGSEEDGTVTGEVTVVVEVGEDTYRAYVAKLEQLDNTDEGVLSVIKYLSRRAGEALEVTIDGDRNVSRIGGLFAGTGERLVIYTTELSDVILGSGNVDPLLYNERELWESRKAIYEMSASDGAVILFRLENN